MSLLRRAVAQVGYWTAFAALYAGSLIADLPRPSDWLARRRIQAARRDGDDR